MITPAHHSNMTHGDAHQHVIVERMVGAARSWLRQRAKPLPIAQAVRVLTTAEHEALKSRMLATVSRETALQTDLDQAIAYLQALGKLAREEE